MKRIAVWNTAFLGDAVLTLPLIQSLALRYPEASIDFYVRGGLEDLFRSHPALASVFGYAKRRTSGAFSGLRSLCRDVAARRYDMWISAHTSPRSGLVALASRAPVRIGYADSPCSRFFYNRVTGRRFTELEEIERLLELLRPLGPGPLVSWPELALGEYEKTEADRFFAALPDGPVLGLHPGSVWATKRWPAAFFADIGSRALALGAQVLLFAGPGEERVAGEVRRLLVCDARHAGHLHDLSASLSLPMLAAFLGRLSCYVSNDSGPMHLAWAQGTPVTAIFGPTVRALGFFPRGEKVTVFERAEPCRPCGLHGPQQCPLGHHRCMTGLLPEAVWPDVAAKLWPDEPEGRLPSSAMPGTEGQEESV